MGVDEWKQHGRQQWRPIWNLRHIGNTFRSDAAGNGGDLNDLWEFNPATNEWAWMSGSSTVGSNGGQSGTYGTLGILSDRTQPGTAAISTTFGSSILPPMNGRG